MGGGQGDGVGPGGVDGGDGVGGVHRSRARQGQSDAFHGGDEGSGECTICSFDRTETPAQSIDELYH